MAYQDRFYTLGKVTVASGSTLVTGTGTGWQTSLIDGGVLYVGGGSYPILSVDSETKLMLAIPYSGVTTADVSYAVDRQRSSAISNIQMNDRLAQIIRDISVGNIELFNALVGSAGKVPIFLSDHSMTLIDVSELGGGGGGGWDVIVTTPAGLAAHENAAVGFRVLVMNNGDGRSAVYDRQASGWSAPVYFTGPAGLNGQDGDDGEPGPPGRDGTSYEVGASGPFSERVNYNDRPEKFSFLATDQGNLYLREGAIGEWSDPIPFGKGEPGRDGKDGLDGAPGSNANVTTATVGAAVAGANGREIFNDADAVTGTISGTSTLARWTWGNIKAWIKGWIVKADVGLGNVSNLAPADLPVSTAQAAADALRVTRSGDTGLGGFTSIVGNYGNTNGANHQIDRGSSNFKSLTNNGPFTLRAPPDQWATYALIVLPAAGAGALTALNFTEVTGTFNPAKINRLHITMLGSSSFLDIKAVA